MSVEIKNDSGSGAPTTVITPTGPVVIKPGRAKSFVLRADGKLHLLDCTCELCQDRETRA